MGLAARRADHRPITVTERFRTLSLLMAATLLATGCERRPDDVPVIASVIGDQAQLANPNARWLEPTERALLGATAQGLVRFDAAGGIEPGIAERWIVIDDGRSYIFRIGAARWPDGTQVTAQDVVTALKRVAAADSRNPLAPYLTAIDQIVVMTPQVIEIRLSAPRPDLLSILAQPELAIFQARGLAGSGPFRIIEDDGSSVLLRPDRDPQAIADESIDPPTPAEHVRLRGERAALAVARFVERQSDLVLGGGFDDWLIVRAAELPPASIRIDPAAGLFGLAVVNRDGFLAEPVNRAAIAGIFDRARFTTALRPDWAAAETLLPDQLDSASSPAIPEWATLDLSTRRLAARARVSIWRAQSEDTPALRVALPSGSGSDALWAFLSNGFASVGLPVTRVTMDADADLRLVDRVAPYDSARWYLAAACDPCSDEAQAAVNAARTASTLAERRAAIAAADIAVAADTPFVLIARPLRWSLVAQRLQRFQPNVRAAHPLNHLRGDPN